ncbi:zinc finger BED domain-containing protein 5-like [Oopsacas minuta]|uniref:Zinc finger BED domain-containing protein 5-like n=1 Tax=Oopsacas minuta TaxID=111878 RepID=A0AAV7JRN9_9METZ|nr:zinc finger BED domain-containing protein 5-like [Oopsacas minuta]
MESAKKRKYNEDYIKYGFTSILKEGRELPQCVICYKVLSEGSMKPSFLKRHLSGCHPNLADKDIDFFKHQEVGVKRIRIDHRGQLSQLTQAGLRASYMVALRIAQEKKPHTIAENLILPSCKDIVHCILGDSAEKKLASLPLSNDTIKRRITDMADDIEQQLCTTTGMSAVHQRRGLQGRVPILRLFGNNYKRRCLPAGTLKEWDYPRSMFLLAQQMVLLLCMEFIRDFELGKRQ